MAKIYEAQIQWQSPAAHRFQAQPLEDYISSGLENVSKAANIASEGIQKLRDQDAAAAMKAAGTAAQDYIDNFEDFSGDNYMGVMEANAMKFWDEAYAQLDEPTKRRFDMNNPRARDIFNLKVHEGAVEKTFDHQHAEYKRRVPLIASQIVALGDPNLIKKALNDKIYELTQNSGMRMQDAEQVIDSIRLEVAQGAISQAIGEGRVADAISMNNDLDFTSALGPQQRAKNSEAAERVLDEQIKAKKELSEDKKRAAVVDSLAAAGVNLYDAMYAAADEDTKSREAVTDVFNKFLSDFINGNLQDQYAGVVVSDYLPEMMVFTDAPYSVRKEAAKKIVGKTLEGNLYDREIKNRLGYRAAALAASVPTDDDGYADIDKIKVEDMAHIAEVLDQVKYYYSFDEGVQKQIDKLSQLYTAYMDRAELALKPSVYQTGNTLVSERTGLGWRTQRYIQTGNLAPDTMDALRSGQLTKEQGAQFNEDYKEAMDAAIQNFAAWTNNGKLPDSGTYREMLMQNAVTIGLLMTGTDKENAGLQYVVPEQIVREYLEQAAFYDERGLLDSEVYDDAETHVGQKHPLLAFSSGANISRESAIQPRLDGMPIKDTVRYKSLVSFAKALNNDVKEEPLESYAAANRSTAYKSGWDRLKNFRLSNTARKADKEETAYKRPAAAAAAKIKVN